MRDFLLNSLSDNPRFGKTLRDRMEPEYSAYYADYKVTRKGAGGKEGELGSIFFRCHLSCVRVLLSTPER